MDSNKRPRLDRGDNIAESVQNEANAAKARLTRACAECKKHKIKCEVKPGNTACNKCLRAGITCVPYNFAQKYMDEDAVWKAQASLNIEQLQSAVQYLLQRSQHPDLAKFNDALSPTIQTLRTTHTAASLSVSPIAHRNESPSVATEHDSDLIPAPMSNLYSLTESRNAQPPQIATPKPGDSDFITNGVVPVVEAEYLFNHYRDHVNPLLWGGALCVHQNLKDARASSSLLIAAVLTVAALHAPRRQQSLDAAYETLVSIVRNSCMMSSQNLDDIRGLCISAFYLTNLSWSLCSRAVRLATEMSLHRAYVHFSRGMHGSHDRLRLWYLLYVCDHQFAIAYGRPPSMHEDAAIKNVDKFLASPMANSGDVRLIAQVNVFRVLTEAYFLYGYDSELELADPDFEKLRSLNLSIDQWRIAFQSKSADMPTYGSYPSKGTILYYQFARFQLNSLALRGVGKSQHQLTPLSWDRREAANTAISAAISTLRLVIEEDDLCKALMGVPIFTHSMIAMCASFLLKLAVTFGKPLSSGSTLVPQDLSASGLMFYTPETLDLVRNLIEALATVAERVSSRHLVNHIVTGLRELLQCFNKSPDYAGFIFTRMNNHSRTVHPSLLSRPPSRNGILRDHREAPFEQHNGGELHFLSESEFAGMHESTNIMGNFDWSFDDNFLWQFDDQNFQY